MNPIGPMTNFPQGFANGLSVRGVPLLQAQTGQVFFVGNCSAGLNPNQHGGSDSNRGTYLDPFATLNYAVNTACVQGRGDIVFVLPGHQEYISSATALPLATNGVAIIGLGYGANRPTFTLDTAATATIAVRAANISIQNCIFVANYADITSCFTCLNSSNATSTIAVGTAAGSVAGVGGVLTVVTPTGTVYPGAQVNVSGLPPGTFITSQLTGTTGGAGTYQLSQTPASAVTSSTITTGAAEFAVDNCEFRDNSSSLNFLALMKCGAVNSCDNGMTLSRSAAYLLGTTANTAIFALPSSIDRLYITDNLLVSATTNNSTLIYQATTTKVITNLLLARNNLLFVGADAATGQWLITTATTHTGVARDNYTTGTRVIASCIMMTTNAGVHYSENYYSVANSQLDGVLMPTVQT